LAEFRSPADGHRLNADEIEANFGENASLRLIYLLELQQYVNVWLMNTCDLLEIGLLFPNVTLLKHFEDALDTLDKKWPRRDAFDLILFRNLREFDQKFRARYRNFLIEQFAKLEEKDRRDDEDSKSEKKDLRDESDDKDAKSEKKDRRDDENSKSEKKEQKKDRRDELDDEDAKKDRRDDENSKSEKKEQKKDRRDDERTGDNLKFAEFLETMK